MYRIQFEPTNDAARSTFSQLICARRMTAGVLAAHEGLMTQHHAGLRAGVLRLAATLREQGDVVSEVAHECALAQVAPAVESNEGHVYVRVPAPSEAAADSLAQALLARFQAASLGRGQWKYSVAPAAGGWSLANSETDYFAWRVTIPMGQLGRDGHFSREELEDALHEAVFGALIGQAVIDGAPSSAPYSGNLHVSLGAAHENGAGGESRLIDLHRLRFSANVAGGQVGFIGVDLMAGSGLIVPAK